jgi:putative SOS response-associated peptidase YedK
MRNLQFMCGRFVSAGSPDRIAAYFDPVVPTEVVAESLGQNFNVAPTQDVYALVGNGDGTARLDAFHWGLVPSWAKDRRIGSRMINARAETLAEKPAFKGLLRAKRCIVPMDGFYEWKPGGEGGPVNAKGKPLKRPMFIHRADGEPLAVAGLWTRWKDPDDPDGRWLHSVTVITTTANATVAPIHDRMPAILPSGDWVTWLDPEFSDPGTLTALLAGRDDDLLVAHEVSTDVNNVRNNRPDLVEPST